ncbi:vWA domain-containing protein [Hoeflea sp.]|uniref:vWA domain-containing protein n=1 Tax=Hoeflea sp. TaxID=1940281 RepID=UPI003B523171
MKIRRKCTELSNLMRNRDGNFAMLAGILVPVVFMAGSLAIDTTNVMSMKSHLQNAVDSAALATATRLYQEENLSIDDAKAFAAEFLEGQVEKDSSTFGAFSISPTIDITPSYGKGKTTWTVAIGVTGTHSATPMARLMGRDELSVSVEGHSASGSEASQGSISMALVLDKSGSMGWKLDGQVKINALRAAVFGLITTLQKVDPEGEYIRLGAASYDSNLDGTEKMHWNLNRVRNFAGDLKAQGGTDSTDAFKWGYDSVDSQTEITEHAAKTGQEPERIIVFMTDGDNNYASADSSTKKLCDKAKESGATVYTIAFAAPERGQQLLSYCASQPENYFDARNADELIAAFETIGEKSSQVVSRLTR